MTRKAVKDSVVANHLVDNAIDDCKLVNFDLSNEYIIVIKTKIDDA
jgi:hypothetical protein